MDSFLLKCHSLWRVWNLGCSAVILLQNLATTITWNVSHMCRLHSAGHLLDSCMRNIGLGSLEPGKGHHFPDGYEISKFALLNTSMTLHLEWCIWVPQFRILWFVLFWFSPFVEYKGAITSKDLESKRVALELDANHLIKCGGQVH